MIRVLIVDDQVIVCEGLKVVLEASPTIRVVGMAHDGAKAVESVQRLEPDLVLMDLKMPGMNGAQATAAIRRVAPALPVLVLTTYDDDEWILDAVRAGAAGYLLKDSRREDLVAAIEGTVAGRTHVDPSVAGRVFAFLREGPPARGALAATFSEREREVLRLLASGLTNAAIADRLALAEGTVRNHVTAILAKLGVADRAQATAIAWRDGLVGPSRAEE
ncbi:MAG TPA: response regulator transcription factor [Ktedonobacterales bacterium]|jgi:DNA-binding NarL/FixJ family response regulator